MGTLKVITSHSLTRLAACMADDLARTPSSLLERETVVVLNNGMARWISMELATLQGVCAGLDFRFPNEVIDNCFRAVLPALPSNSPFTRDAMTWRIAARLPGLLNHPGFEQVVGYLGKCTDDRRLLQISRALADLFDQYIIFRPEMILAWDNGKDDGWQSVLWREVASDTVGQHRAALLNTFRERIKSGAVSDGTLPRRISLFGISYLPPFHLQAFSLLAQFTNIAFYLQNPCGAYWGDIVSRQRLAELVLRDSMDADEYYDTGNPLLSSLGTMGQEFHDMLLEFGFDAIDLDQVDEQPTTTLLEVLQHDIRQLRDSGGRDKKHVCATSDRSLQVNSCHGPLREMEVLYDNMLAMFDDSKTLEPGQIVVMIPDIEAYAPYIAAVFGARSGGRPAIPFTIADRSQCQENRAIETFFRILGLPATRFGVNQILELLESPHVLARFGITSNELETIREWLRVSGVRWGFDAAQRVELGFPPYDDFSWQAALNRLFLGYAMVCDDDRLFSGILPFEGLEGRAAAPLGKLADFLQVTRSTTEVLSRRHTLIEWADELTTIALGLILSDDSENGLKTIFSALQTLREAQQVSGFCAQISLEGVQDCLNGLLNNTGVGYGFLGGRVTFCAMLPMRSIPFRVVCLAGMNDGVFPRNKPQPAFSLMAGRRRRGDRSLRDEDRYLFLETILAAGERLCISYTGQSDRDNSSLLSSVVVAELLDYVQRAFTIAGTDAAPPQILIRHRLQPFSSDYFSNSNPAGLFSYSTEYRAALQAGQLSGRPLHNFITEPLADDPELLQNIDLGELKRFLANPAATFLRRRMGIRPHSPDDEVYEREPFAMDSLTAYSLRQNLVKRILCGRKIDREYQAARARALLPPLVAGRVAFEKTLAESRGFAHSLAPSLEDELEPLAVVLTHDGMTLVGVLNGIRSKQHLHWRCATMKAKDRLGLWLEHLILNALVPSGYPRESLLVCNDLTMSLAPLDNAAVILGELMELYREGLRRPLPFFPQVSWLYLTTGMEKAQGRWNGSDHASSSPEASDPACSLCFCDQDPLDNEFEELSRIAFEPLLAVATEEIRGA
jgi:exodeoxyribonuclease V gamma subunit